MSISERKKLIRFMQAIRKQDIETVKKMLEQGVDANGYEDRAKFTPLHVAATYGVTEIIPLLINAGANVDNETDDHLKPADFAKNEQTFYLLTR